MQSTQTNLRALAPTLAAGLLGSLCCLSGVGRLSAQIPPNASGSSSSQYFVDATTFSHGGRANSFNFRLDASIAETITSVPASSQSFSMAAGFVTTLASDRNRPWVSGATPAIHQRKAGGLIWITGTRLTLSPPTVTVGGKPATILASSPTSIAVRAPDLDPGFHPITVTNAAGSSTIERGHGVLPLLYARTPSGSEVPFDLVFRGTQGDTCLWIFGFTQIPIQRLSGIHYGLLVGNPPVILSTAIFQSNNEARVRIPAAKYGVNIYIQALFRTSNPSYAPASFSNVITL